MTENENINEAVSAEAEDAKKEASEPKSKKSDAKHKGELAKAQEAAKKAEDELAEYKDKYLRLAAEYDNFRRRSAKEKECIYSDAISDVVTHVLPIFDNLERAAVYESAEKVAEGLAMTAKTIDEVLTKVGIEKFGAVGDEFDPNLHNAVLHCEDEAFGENKIAEVFQCGYKKGERVIRYAMVKVAN